MNPLSRLRSIALDTNIFIYHFDSKSPFHLQASRLFEEVTRANKKIFTSNITLIEALSFKAPEEKIKALQKEFLQMPNLQIIEVSNHIALTAARIRRQYYFRLPDSIQLATALDTKTAAFISNDQRLKKFKEIPIIFLS